MRAWPVWAGLGVLFGSSLALAQSGPDLGLARGAAVVTQTARLTLFAGHAEWHARVEAQSDGSPRASAEVWFQAEGAVGSGLTLFEPDGRRIEARLLWAPGAERIFEKFVGPGYDVRDPGFMRQVGPGALAISVLPVLAGQSRTFEYRATLPTRYEAGRHRSLLPTAFEGEVTVESGERDAALFLDDSPLASGSRVSIAEATELSLELGSPPPVVADLAVVPLAGRNYVRFEARLAAELQAVPRDAALVVAIDHSRSMGQVGARAARVAARAYLDHFESGRVRVMHFARAASWQQRDFVSPAAATRRIALQAPLENGSDVTEALRAASAALRDLPGEKRILLITDARVSREIAPAVLAEVMRGSGALVHTAVLAPAPELSMSRSDGHAWAPATHATGGVLWQLQVPATSLDSVALHELVEPWAHPIELEQVAWSAANLALPTLPPRLGRGEGLLREGFVSGWPSEVKLTGLLWSKRVELRVVRDSALSRRWSRLLLGSSLAAELSPREDASLADQTRSVSATRSLLAIEPGARPVGGSPSELLGLLDTAAAGDPNEPLQPFMMAGPAERACMECWGRRVTDAVAGGIEISVPDERQARDERARARTSDLTRRLRALAARCRITRGAAEIEATLDEIVSVTITAAPLHASACLEAAVWALDLGPTFTARHELFRIDLT